MRNAHKFGLMAFVVCALLFFLSGAPLQRGWPLWTAGVFTVVIVLAAMAAGHGVDKGGDNGHT